MSDDTPTTRVTLEIDRIIPVEKVLATARRFLDTAGWEMEFEDEDGETERVAIPRDADLVVASRAFVRADLLELSFGNHLSAIVLIGAERKEKNPVAKFGILRLYFNEFGAYITEDHFRHL